MSRHDWSDDSFDWNALNDCIDICYKWANRGFIPGQIKEKFGGLRWYAMFGHLSLHGILFPGYIYCQYPKWLNWLWGFEIYYINPVLQFFFNRLFISWQVFCYKKAYKECLQKHPHIAEEILGSADHIELLSFLKEEKEIKDGYRTRSYYYNNKLVARWGSVYEEK